MDNPYETGMSVMHTDSEDPDNPDIGIITKIVDNEYVMVLWEKDNELGEHHISIIHAI